jgi:hypothetical protein
MINDTETPDRPVIRLDMTSIFLLAAGACIDVDFELDGRPLKLRLAAGGDARRMQWDIRRRQSCVRKQKPLGAKERE